MFCIRISIEAQRKPKQRQRPTPPTTTKSPRCTDDPDLRTFWTKDIMALKCIGRGISSFVFAIDDLKVIKYAKGFDNSILDRKTERRAFRIIENAKDRSPHLIKCFEIDNPWGIVIERCRETVRQRLRSLQIDVFPYTTEAERWAKQAAEGLAFLHLNDIIHADVGCHNMLLTAEGELKLCDFGGSSVEGSEALMKYEVWSRPPGEEDSPPTKLSDLFALGSAIYEMATKMVPYAGKSKIYITQSYQKGKFPRVTKIVSLGTIITKCWSHYYENAQDIAWDIDPQNLLCCGPGKNMTYSKLA